MMQIGSRRKFLVAIVAILLSACARPPSPPPLVSMPAEFPAAYYRQLEAAGRPVLRVDSGRSLVVIEVRRAGPLARMGHDHVVAAREVSGLVAVEEGRADLVIALDRLSVDEPALRSEAGFNKQPEQDAIDGTRRNMLQKVLEVERYPWVQIRATRSAPASLHIAMTLHGTTRAMEIPAQIDTLADGIVVSGRLAFRQSDFGIVPYSVLGGALQVQDQVDLRFRIVARVL